MLNAVNINLLLVVRLLTKHSLFNPFINIKKSKHGECDRYFVQYLRSSLLIEWTVEEVEQWLTQTGFKEEAPLISGKFYF